MRHDSQFRSFIRRVLVIALLTCVGGSVMTGCLNDEEMIDHHEHVLDQEDE